MSSRRVDSIETRISALKKQILEDMDPTLVKFMNDLKSVEMTTNKKIANQ